MKKIILGFMAVATLAIATQSCNNKAQAAAPDTAVTLAVEGMSCGESCPKAITEKVTKIAGVGKCDVSYETKTCVVDFDSKATSADKIVEGIASIADGQYKVSVVSTTPLTTEKKM